MWNVTASEALKVQKIEYNEKTKFLINVEVGQMPPGKVKVHLDEQLKWLKTAFPDNEVIVVSMRNGKPGITFATIDPK